MSVTTWLRLALLASTAAGCGPVVGNVITTTDDTDAEPLPCGADEVPRFTGEDGLGWEEEPYLVCGPMLDDGLCPTDPAQVRSYVRDALGPVSDPDFCGWMVGQEVCGPVPAGRSECCFVARIGVICEGRPLMVERAARTARSVHSVDWLHELESLPSPDPQTRAVALPAWRRAALAEHASVASFARFTLELLALGAPADLIAEATRAQADEVRHARQAFAVLSWLSAAPRGPGPLALDGVEPRTDAAAVLAATLLEGCLNETLAAAEAAEAARRCTTPALTALLSDIAQDESRHAALAWRAVRWLVGHHPELLPEARRVIRDALAEAADTRELPEPSAEPWLRAGLLPPHDAARLRERVRQQVVRPVATSVLGPLDDTCAAA